MPDQSPLALVQDADKLTSAQLSSLLNSPEMAKRKALGQVTLHRVAYLRISKDKSTKRDGGGLGVQRQYRAICKHCPEPIEWWYVDNDTSAFSGVDRPDYLIMRHDIESGVIDPKGQVWAAFADRMHRNTAEAIEFMELCFDYRRKGTHDRDIVLHTATGPMNFHTADGRKAFVDVSTSAEHYSAIIAEKVGLKFDEKVDEGQPLSGKRKFGYKVGGMEHEPAEAEAIRSGAKMIRAGKSLSEVARSWTARGIRTPGAGNPIDTITVRNAMLRPATAGKVLRRGKVTQGSWEPILDEETWEAVRVILLDPKRQAFQKQGSKIRWLGTGQYLCGGCGSTMYVLGGSYRCKSIRLNKPHIRGSHVARIADKLDAYIDATLLAALQSEDLAAEVAKQGAEATPDSPKLRERKAEIEVEIDAYRELVGQPGWGPKEIGAAVSKLTVELQAIERELVADAAPSLVAQTVAGGVTAEAWGKTTVEEKRALLGEMVTVTILRSPLGLKRLAPEYIKLDWNI
jgi:site-specific DNA recombinase